MTSPSTSVPDTGPIPNMRTDRRSADACRPVLRCRPMIEKPAASLGEPCRTPHTARRRGTATVSWLRERRDLLAIAGAAALLAARAVYELGRYSFSQDEIASVVYSSAPLHELLSIVGRDRQVADAPFMATYNLLLHFWLSFADSEAEIRLHSVIAGVAATIPIYFISANDSAVGWLARLER